MKNNSVEISGVEKHYGSISALNKIELSIGRRGLIVITGESGSGKTTLLNILGLLDSRDAGRVLICNEPIGKDITSEHCDYVRNKYLSYMFQDDILLNQFNIKENISYSQILQGNENEEHIVEVAEKLGIDDLLDRYPYEVSRGQRQRAALARATVSNGKILLADEPTGNLDTENSEQIFNHLKDIAQKQVVIVVTHNVQMALKYADRILEMKDGSIVSDKTLNIKNLEESTNDSEEKREKKVLPNLSFKYLLRHAWADVRFGWREIKKVCATGMLTMIVFVLMLAAFFNSNSELNDLEKKYFGKNLVNLTPNLNWNIETALAAKYGVGSYLGDYSFLSSLETIDEYVCKYNISLKALNGIKEGELENVTSVKLNDFFKTNMQYLEVKGDVVESDEDIILARDVAKELFGGNYKEHIGQELYLTGIFTKQKFRIVGINEKKDVNGEIQSYISEKALYNLCVNDLKVASLQDSACVYGSASYSVIEDGEENNQGNIYSVGDEADAKIGLIKEAIENIVIGSMPKRPDEVLVNMQFIEKNSTNIFGIDISEKDLLEAEIIKERVLSEELYIVFAYAGTIAKVKIAGVYNDLHEEKADILVSNDCMKELQTVYPEKIQVYMNDDADVATLEQLFYEEGFECEVPYKDYEDGISGKFSMLKVVLCILSIVMAIVAFSVINTFSANNIHKHTQDIGLLRAFGASKKTIIHIFTVETAMIGVITGILTLLVLGVLDIAVKVLENSFSNSMFTLLAFSLLEALIAVGIGILLFLLASIFPIRSINKKLLKDTIYGK